MAKHIEPDRDLKETLIRTVPAGLRRELRVYSVVTTTGHSVKLQNFADDGFGMAPTGQLFVFRRELAPFIEAVAAAKAALDALPRPNDCKPRTRPARAGVDA